MGPFTEQRVLSAKRGKKTEASAHFVLWVVNSLQMGRTKNMDLYTPIQILRGYLVQGPYWFSSLYI